MNLFTVKLKFLKAHHSYRLEEIVYVGLVSGLELKKYELQIKMPGNGS